MGTEKFVPEWEWVRVVEEYPDYIDVKLRIKDPKTGRLTALFINTFRESYKLPMASKTLANVFQNAKKYVGLEATTIRIYKKENIDMQAIKDIIADHTAKLKKFCIYVDESITEYVNEHSIYNWCWQVAVFNRFTERFEPVSQKKEDNEDNTKTLSVFVKKLAGEQND